MIAWRQSCRSKYDSFLSEVAHFANSRRRQGVQMGRDGLKRDVNIIDRAMDDNSRPFDAVEVTQVFIIVAVSLPDSLCHERILFACFVEDFRGEVGIDFPLRQDRLSDFENAGRRVIPRHVGQGLAAEDLDRRRTTSHQRRQFCVSRSQLPDVLIAFGRDSHSRVD